jgi:hypothetical protein
MAMVSYYNTIISIRNTLDTLITTIAMYSGTTYFSPNYQTEVGDYPSCFIEIMDDDIDMMSYSGKRWKVKPGFAIVVRTDAGSDADAANDILISGVSAIVGKIKDASTSLYGVGPTSGDVKLDKLYVEEVDYSYQSPGATPALIKEARIIARAETSWLF